MIPNQWYPDRRQVTEWRFAPGSAVGWHRPKLPCLIVPITSGNIRVARKETRRD